MSLRPAPLEPIPEQTVVVAQAAFPKANLYMRMRDELGVFHDDRLFGALYSVQGAQGIAPWRLALVTLMQFVENLSDRQAAEAVRGRIDWKYALGLALTDAGFDFSVLSEFRSWLVNGGQENLLLEAMLARLKERSLLKAGGRQRSDATHVLAAIRALNRLEVVGETLRAALNALARSAPDWLSEQAPPEWLERYAVRVDVYRLPKTEAGREAAAEVMGTDGHRLLAALYEPEAPFWLRSLPAVETLRVTWIQQFCLVDDQVRWRKPADQPPPGQRRHSPYDREAVCGTKRGESWIGYKVHLTETCEPDTPHLIVDVQTTRAAVVDTAMTAVIHHALAARGVAPATHLVDSGYIDGALLVASRTEQAIELVGPARPDTSWHNKAGEGFDVSAFTLDWPTRSARCPQGHSSVRWTTFVPPIRGLAVRITFDPQICQACPSRPLCTRAPTGGRTLSLLPQAEHEAVQTRRREQETADWKRLYGQRAGVEGLLSQGIRAFGLRQSRYLGLAKTHLQHVLTAAAINLVRLDAWLRGVPLAPTRLSRFAALMSTA
jgi:transposase